MEESFQGFEGCVIKLQNLKKNLRTKRVKSRAISDIE